MSDGSRALFSLIRDHYVKKLESGETDAVGVFSDMSDVLARIVATQPNAARRQGLITHLTVCLPTLVEHYVAAQVAQGDFGKVAPKPDPKPQILKPMEREKRFVERAKGESP